MKNNLANLMAGIGIFIIFIAVVLVGYLSMSKLYQPQKEFEAAMAGKLVTDSVRYEELLSAEKSQEALFLEKQNLYKQKNDLEAELYQAKQEKLKAEQELAKTKLALNNQESNLTELEQSNQQLVERLARVEKQIKPTLSAEEQALEKFFILHKNKIPPR